MSAERLSEGGYDYFATPALAQRLDLIQHLLEFGSQTVLVMGPTGSGKTALLGEAGRRAGQAGLHCLLQGAAELGPQALLAEVAEAFDLPYTAQQPLTVGERDLELFAQARRAEATPVVIAVDDAERLPPESLALLGRLAYRSAGALRVLMAGQPELARLVAVAQGTLPERQLPHTIDLPPFSVADTARLLAHIGAEDLLAEADRVREWSAGLPGRIVELARGAGLPPMPGPAARPARPPRVERARPPQPELWRPSPRMAGILGAGLVAGFAAIWLLSLLDGGADSPREPVKITLELPPAAGQPPAGGQAAGGEDGSGLGPSPDRALEPEAGAGGPEPAPLTPPAGAGPVESPEFADEVFPLEAAPGAGSSAETLQQTQRPPTGGTAVAEPPPASPPVPVEPAAVVAEGLPRPEGPSAPALEESPGAGLSPGIATAPAGAESAPARQAAPPELSAPSRAAPGAPGPSGLAEGAAPGVTRPSGVAEGAAPGAPGPSGVAEGAAPGAPGPSGVAEGAAPGVPRASGVAEGAAPGVPRASGLTEGAAPSVPGPSGVAQGAAPAAPGPSGVAPAAAPPGPAREPLAPPPAGGGLRGEEWLAAQEPGRWVLQLYATGERALAERFVRRYGLGEQAALYSTRRNGATLNVVVYGLYASRQDALAAVRSLPAQVRRLEPWPRSIKAVSQAMREDR